MLLLLILSLLSLPTLLYLALYVLPQIYVGLRPVPDLKRKYNATWALVTGAGSGLGRALCFQLAEQGLNVVVVSLDDEYLEQTINDLTKKYPDLEFRKVGVNFAPNVDYLTPIKEATKDITVQCLFMNAGFIVTGFLDQTKLDKLLVNIECNATAAVKITHQFLVPLVEQRKKGCILFTSSAAAFIPTPFAVLYSSTKAFLSQFAASLAIEVQSLGIDIGVVHPSPVSSNFYDKVDHRIELMEEAAKQAQTPDVVAKQMIQSVGGAIHRDLGGTFLVIFCRTNDQMVSLPGRKAMHSVC